MNWKHVLYFFVTAGLGALIGVVVVFDFYSFMTLLALIILPVLITGLCVKFIWLLWTEGL